MAALHPTLASPVNGQLTNSPNIRFLPTIMGMLALCVVFGIADRTLAQVQPIPAYAPAANAALLSALDPASAAAPSAAPIYDSQVQPAAFQQPGIVRATTVPEPTIAQPESFPYELTASATLPIASSPSDKSYLTDQLTTGSRVEVYRHDPDGWLAIRPPVGSFSLIKGEDAQPTGQPGIYQVIRDQAKAWVGTRIDQQHQPISQVRLKAGEKVTVQSSIEVQDGNRKQVWLQIDPPSGEFRWVHARHFPSAFPSAPGTTDHSVVPSSNPQHTQADVPPLELAEDTPAKAPTWRAAQRETPEMGYADPTYALTSNASPEDNHLAGKQGTSPSWQNVSHTDSIPSRPRQPEPAQQWDEAVRKLSQNQNGFYQNTAADTDSNLAAAVPAPQWNQYLNRLNHQLSLEIVKPAEQWSLAPLLQQSQSLLQSAPTSAQKDAATALQQRILNFLQLQKQKPGPNDLTAGISQTRFASAGNQVFPASTPPPAASSPSSNVQPVSYENPYQAVGYLKELILDRGRQPNTFVLQDANGKTLCHITPLPGVQLHQVLDRKIGVKGRPGYHAQLKLPHVTVESFDRLN